MGNTVSGVYVKYIRQTLILFLHKHIYFKCYKIIISRGQEMVIVGTDHYTENKYIKLYTQFFESTVP